MYDQRRQTSIENDRVRVTVLHEGGHVAEILDKGSGVNPLWVPPWPSIEPSQYSLARNPEYGRDAESRLLAGIAGHSICLDYFGAPSQEEAAAGLSVHGEAPVTLYEVSARGSAAKLTAVLPLAQIRHTREISLDGENVRFHETVENLGSFDRPIGWTQHVTLGPPFLDRSVTQFRYPSVRARKYDSGEEFAEKQVSETFTSAEVSGGFTTHLMDARRERSFFVAWSPRSRVAFGYSWRTTDFPWLGIWEENHSRTTPPWNGRTLTRGMEFGVSPVPESRRHMIERGKLFGVPTYRFIPAKSRIEVSYSAWIGAADRLPDDARF